MEEKDKKFELPENVKLLDPYMEKCKSDGDGAIIIHLDKESNKVFMAHLNCNINLSLSAVKLLIMNFSLTRQQIDMMMMEEQVKKNKKPLLIPPKGLTDVSGKPLKFKKPDKN